MVEHSFSVLRLQFQKGYAYAGGSGDEDALSPGSTAEEFHVQLFAAQVDTEEFMAEVLGLQLLEFRVRKLDL